MGGRHNKTEILARGMNLIREQGYSKTGINEILKVCGIPKGSFYNFFSSKEDFGFQTIDLYAKYIHGMYKKFNDDPSLDPVDKLKGFFRLSNENFRSEGCLLNCLLLSLSNEISEANNTFAARVLESFEEFKEYLIDWVSQGQENQSIRSDYSARELADYLYDSYHGAVIRMKYLGNCKPLEAFMKHHLVFILL